MHVHFNRDALSISLKPSTTRSSTSTSTVYPAQSYDYDGVRTLGELYLALLALAEVREREGEAVAACDRATEHGDRRGAS